MGKSVIFTAKGCLKSVWKHPFLVCTLCFWMLMFRLSPVIFSLFVSASPVFACTAVLLAALLSFGGPNVPETEVEEKTKCLAAMVTCGESRVSNVGKIGRKRQGELVLASKPREILRGGSLVGTIALVENKGGIREVNRKIGDVRRKKKSRRSDGSDRDVVGKNDALNRVVRQHLESDYEKSEADSFDSERVNVDSPPCSPWGKVENRGNEGDEEDYTVDSGSDVSETSSPDASMTDMIPMLDELHPLLDEDAGQLVQMSLRGSHATSEMSLLSSTSGNESDVETNEDLDVGDYDDVMHGDKDKLVKPAIIWTEEDQKNLQDLGSSEIERNQRLESLMQRRQERKYKSMVSDIDLIDMEIANSQFNLAPISTTRQNPFDVSNVAYDNSGVHLIPGSAPSILAPRRNPFDTPCDSGEEKSNVAGNRFQDELGLLPPRETFRKHDSFIVGPSVYATGRQGKYHVKMTPYFIPDSTIPTAETRYSPFLQPSSEMSSRLSSMPGTTSVSSIEDLEDQRLMEEENPKELKMSSDMVDVTKNHQSTDQVPIPNRQSSKQDDNPVPKMVSKHVIQYSKKQSSIDSSDHYRGGNVVQPEQVPSTRYHSGSKAIEPSYKRVLSSSSLSEANERAFKETEGEEALKDDVVDDGSTATTVATSPTEVQPKEPVYDSSPPSLRKNFSFSSFNLQSESPLDLLPLHIKRTISMIERHYERISRETDKDNSNNVAKTHEPSKTHLEDKHKSSDGHTNTHKPGNINSDSSKIEQSCKGDDVSNVDTPPKATNDKNSGHFEVEKRSNTVLERENLTRVRISSSEGEVEASKRIDGAKTIPSENTEDKDDNNDDDDDDDDIYHETNVKISTPSVGGGTTTTVFYNITMNDPNSERLEEVQVPNTPIDAIDKLKAIPNLNIPNIHELMDTTLHVDSPYTPDFPSMPSSASKETGGPHFNMETILEEVQEIKEIDEMSETDNECDIYWRTHPTAFDKYVDSDKAIQEKLGLVRDVEEISRVVVHKMDDHGISPNSETSIDER